MGANGDADGPEDFLDDEPEIDPEVERRDLADEAALMIKEARLALGRAGVDHPDDHVATAVHLMGRLAIANGLAALAEATDDKTAAVREYTDVARDGQAQADALSEELARAAGVPMAPKRPAISLITPKPPKLGEDALQPDPTAPRKS